MILLQLALKSIRNRMTSTFLTVFSIALSVSLLLAVERTKQAAEEGFTQSISQVDLLVGARTGPLNLILYTVFNMGSPSNNVSWQSYEEFKKHPDVEWTIPYSLGDGHRGFRVVGTDENFYQHYRFRGDKALEFAEGRPAANIFDVVLGSDVAKRLNYRLDDKIVVGHGVTRGEAVQKHDDKPFVVTGTLKATGTAIDQSLYITLQGMEAIHMDWQSGVQPSSESSIPASQIKMEDLKTTAITSFFLRTKSRIETLRLQRTINEYEQEALMAIIPGATLTELWRGLSQIELVLKLISLMVMIVGLAALVSTLLAGLNERRREMAILRSVGASAQHITLLLVLESTILTIVGILLGVLIQIIGFSVVANWLASEFGFYFTGNMISKSALGYLGLFLVAGFLSGFLPAIRATQLSLKDGLTVKQ